MRMRILATMLILAAAAMPVAAGPGLGKGHDLYWEAITIHGTGTVAPARDPNDTVVTVPAYTQVTFDVGAASRDMPLTIILDPPPQWFTGTGVTDTEVDNPDPTRTTTYSTVPGGAHTIYVRCQVVQPNGRITDEQLACTLVVTE